MQALSGAPDSSMPSAMLEQEAQIFGLRERALPFSVMGSPQHRQMEEFMGSWFAESQRLLGVPGSFERRPGTECGTYP